MGGLYDILESYRLQEPKFTYEGLYEDEPYKIATSNLLQALEPGYEYRSQDFIDNAFRTGGYDLSGNVPVDFDRRVDFRRYFDNKPLRPTDGVARFIDFAPRVGNITPVINSNTIDNPIYQMKQLQGMIPTGIMTQIDQNQFTDDAGLEEEYYEDFPQKFKPGLNIDFAKQLGASALGLISKNPVVGLIARGLGALGDRFNLPGVVGGADLRGDTGFDTFRRSTSLADFFRRQRDKKAREDAAKRGLEKQRIQAKQKFDQNVKGFFSGQNNNGGNQGGGFADNSNASAPGGSNEMGSF